MAFLVESQTYRGGRGVRVRTIARYSMVRDLDPGFADLAGSAAGEAGRGLLLSAGLHPLSGGKQQQGQKQAAGQERRRRSKPLEKRAAEERGYDVGCAEGGSGQAQHAADLVRPNALGYQAI